MDRPLFKLPIRISVPLYSPPQTQYSTPLAHLVLQADSYRMFQFIVSTFSIMLATYLLLALILSIAITWCINRLMVYPLRAIITELKNLPAQRIAHHQLTLPAWHQDDEIGALVRCYNRNQQLLEQSLLPRSMSSPIKRPMFSIWSSGWRKTRRSALWLSALNRYRPIAKATALRFTIL